MAIRSCVSTRVRVVLREDSEGAAERDNERIMTIISGGLRKGLSMGSFSWFVERAM